MCYFQQSYVLVMRSDFTFRSNENPMHDLLPERLRDELLTAVGPIAFAKM